jgi:hypothetical protein
VYSLLDCEGKPFYVGKGNGYRCRDHFNEKRMKRDTNRYKVSKIKKVMAETGSYPKIQFVKIGLSENEAFSLEIKTIKRIGRNKLTNYTDGGEGISGFKLSEETKRKIGKANSGKNSPNYGKPLAEEIKKKVSESLSGEKHYLYGKYRSEKTKEKIRRKLKGLEFSEETRKKISDAIKGEKHYNYGKHRSEETKRKISETQKGRTLSSETKERISKKLKNRKFSEKTKRKMSESQKRRFAQAA